MHSSKRFKQGSIAAGSAATILLAMSINIGGRDHVASIIAEFGFVFLAALALAFVIGGLLRRLRLWWSAFVGIAVGFACGFGIVTFVASRI
jgi:hypothetical protein